MATGGVPTRTDEESARRLVHVRSSLHAHARLLADGVRNKAFYAALRKRVTPGCSVLDIGSGTGLWAVAAALLGAERVVAVERDEFLLPVIDRIARENGVADRVQIAHGQSWDLDVDGPFDVVVSETIGNLGFEEEIVRVMLDAKSRFLSRGGSLIPERVKLVVAPAYSSEVAGKVPAGVAIRFGSFQSLRANMPTVPTDRSALEFRAKPRTLLDVDLTTLEDAPDVGGLHARWKLDDTRKLNCFAAWSTATLVEGVRLSTLRAPSWTPVVYPIEPLKGRRGSIDFTLSLSEAITFWTVRLSSSDGSESQSYSPVFAHTSLEAELQRLHG
jgi:protein arginine N-methyltransferase 1